MTVKNISLTDFRNYEKGSVSFDDNCNVIIGDNAQGKTNLLEAIFYLTGARSFRARSDNELIRFGCGGFEVSADILSGGRSQNLRAKVVKGRKKELYANNVKLKTASELSGRLTAVLFSPDDLYIIKEGAAARRRLMDNCICQMRPRYAQTLSQFRKTYDSKTKLLKDIKENPGFLPVLEEYNLLFARLSATLIYYRSYFAESLSEYAGKIHRDFSGGKEELTLNYKTVSTVTDPKAKPSVIFEEIMEHQKSHLRAELDSCQCLTGAHKDDLEIMINSSAAKSFASQGQTRTAALSIKLAEREIHFADSGEYPILLLDDVLSELDAARQNYILNRIGSGQVFITCCEDSRISEKTGGRIIAVKEGAVL